MCKKVMAILLAIMVMQVPLAHAIKFTVDSSDKGQFHDLKVTRASSSGVSGGVATIDLSTLAQSSATGAAAVVTFSQSDLDQSMFSFTCTEGSSVGNPNTCSCYTTTNAAKTGAIKVDINDDGIPKYIRLWGAPD